MGAAMILGHSELPPLSLVHVPMQIFAPHITPEIMQLMFPFRIYLDDAICRALAERGDWLQDMALRDDVQGAWWIGSAK